MNAVGVNSGSQHLFRVRRLFELKLGSPKFVNIIHVDVKYVNITMQRLQLVNIKQKVYEKTCYC